MRILFVTPNPSSRIRLRGYRFLAQLQRAHEVTPVNAFVATALFLYQHAVTGHTGGVALTVVPNMCV